MVRSDEQGQKIFENLTKISENYLYSTVNLLGMIPYSQTVRKAVLQREPLMVAEENGEIARRLRSYCSQNYGWRVG